jgi:spermidine/putrescine transport system ATP-binding protein
VQTSVTPSVGSEGAIALRPEKIRIADQLVAEPSENRFEGQVAGLLYMGDVTVYIVATAAGTRLEALLANSAAGRTKLLEIGDRVLVAWPADAGHFIAG